MKKLKLEYSKIEMKIYKINTKERNTAMKNALLNILILILMALISCNENALYVADKGTAIVLNGKSKSDTVEYICHNCDSFKIDTLTFNTVLRKATSDIRNTLNYPLSFDPVKLEIYVSTEDSIFLTTSNEKLNLLSFLIRYNYIGKNAYGTELEGESIVNYYSDRLTVVDIENKRSLSSLKFNQDGIINRTLKLYDADSDANIELMPITDGKLIVITNGCVDKGILLNIILENGDKISKESWNNFNCSGTCYYHKFTKEEIVKLKQAKVKYISLYTDNLTFCSVPENQRDYFQQFADLAY